MAKISQKRLKEKLNYDPNTGIFKWKKNFKTAGGFDEDKYIRITIDYVGYRAHRLAWLYIYGKWPIDQIDHINGIRTDNRIENLREATSSQNSRNRKMSSLNTSGIVGISWEKQTNKWKASIRVNNKNITLGRYDNKNLAGEARKQAEIRYGFHKNHGRRI